MQTKTTAVIGSGRIGRAWAIVFARSGFDVKLHDASQDMLRDAVPAIRESVEDLASFDLIDEPAEAIENVRQRHASGHHLENPTFRADTRALFVPFLGGGVTRCSHVLPPCVSRSAARSRQQPCRAGGRDEVGSKSAI